MLLFIFRLWFVDSSFNLSNIRPVISVTVSSYPVWLCVIPTVAESMRINDKLTSANKQQEATIVSLNKVSGETSPSYISRLVAASSFCPCLGNVCMCFVVVPQELEEMRSKLIKDKMSSLRHDRADSHTGKEQHVQKLQQKLNMVNDKQWTYVLYHTSQSTKTSYY